MKRINAMLIAGSLLIAGALTETASAQNYYNNGYGFGNNGYYNNYYNQGGLSRFINRTSNKLIGTPIVGNRWNNGSFCNDNYNGGYWNNRPGIISRIFNRIF